MAGSTFGLVWGEGDELGTVNLLTEDVVKAAAAKEIKYVPGPFCVIPSFIRVHPLLMLSRI